MWPLLIEAKDSAEKIKKLVDELLKSQSRLSKKEIAQHADLLLEETEAAINSIGEEIENMCRMLEGHKKYLKSKQRFLKRHYKRL